MWISFGPIFDSFLDPTPQVGNIWQSMAILILATWIGLSFYKLWIVKQCGGYLKMMLVLILLESCIASSKLLDSVK